ncbi:hypothetical protein [Nocardioides sp. B-3]|uniref:hypothetical protein n=1 Tax=Nocardioides sp. B-3 TaxID=2895565 RepID=UPI0021534070|nr:hypothetical protein [Nocardioides sp. B-3]UUZ58760.1 hypothetical protein LP418_22110 [Nocardioides sp. B-3]
MSPKTGSRLVAPRTTTQRDVVRAPAGTEARRLLRRPLLPISIPASALLGAEVLRSSNLDGDWNGAEYSSGPVVMFPLILTIALMVAEAFHRERHPVGIEAPTESSTRAAGSLLGALVLVAIVGLMTVGVAGYVAGVGGLDLGDEPGRTLHARFSVGELLQHVALAVLAIATGAAAGRRFASRVTAGLVLFAGWFPPMFVYWMFRAPAIVPFSIVQVQPVNVRVAHENTDPLTLPAEWLLSSPGEFRDYWGRQFVSSALAGWHDLWLLGLACLFLSLVFTGRWRRRLLAVGAVLAVAGISAQYAVIPR